MRPAIVADVIWKECRLHAAWNTRASMSYNLEYCGVVMSLVEHIGRCQNITYEGLCRLCERKHF